MDKIYVLVPVYNVKEYLNRCIESILQQTYTNWELVLVNDGSTDGSGAICDRYAAEHDNITVIHQENSGVSVARNTAVEYALNHGDHEQDWINFVDSDDFVHPKYLEYLYRAAKEAGTEISSCGFVRANANETDHTNMGGSFKYEQLSSEEYWCRKYTNASVAWGKLYRLSLFDKIRYPVGKLYEDGYTTHKLLFNCSIVAVIWHPMYCWYINPFSITQDSWKPNQMDALYALDEQTAYLKEKGYLDAYKISLLAMLRHSIKHLMSVYALSPKYDAYLKELRERQKRVFILCLQELGWKKTISMWIEIRIFKPFNRILRNESIISFATRKIKKKFFRC